MQKGLFFYFHEVLILTILCSCRGMKKIVDNLLTTAEERAISIYRVSTHLIRVLTIPQMTERSECYGFGKIYAEIPGSR